MKIIEQKEKLAAYIDKVDNHVIISVTDTDGVIKYVSKAFCDISGFTKQELIGKKHNIVRHPDMDKKLYENIWQTISSGKIWSGDIKNRAKDGKSYWVKANIEPIFGADREINGYQAIRLDITDKKIIEKMSITDELTGLYNRRYFNVKIAERLNLAKEQKTPFAFFMMDVDNFKKYNDTYGHKMGDDVLMSVGKVMREMVSMEGDMAFRLGGEEFGAIIAVKDANDALNITNSVREALEGLAIEHSKNSASPFVTASFGLVCVDFANTDIEIDAERVYIKADEALYKAKEGGRNRVALAD